MLDKWAHNGHKLGECWVDLSNDITYVHVPKNASSFIKGCLQASTKWQHSDTLVNSNRYLIALRDPIERWCSGMAQYQINSRQLKLDVTEVFNQITFDDHTEQQIYFLRGIDLNKVTFVMINNTFNNTISRWFSENGYVVNVDTMPRFNQSSDVKLGLKQKYQQLVDSNPNYMLQLKKHFSADYELINKVKFYAY
jgi:hypothetical protein